MSSKVANIIVERLVRKIKESNRLPWQRPFIKPSMNWYTKREYRGINRLLLDGGEYITPKQLMEYNKRNKTNFWFKKGTPYELVVFYTANDILLTPEEVAEMENSGRIDPYVCQVGDKWVRKYWVLRYYRVYNICYIEDKQGNKLEPRLGKDVVEVFTPAEEIVSNYLKGSGVKLKEEGGGSCYYLFEDDTIYTPFKKYFKSTEAYYRTLFHEMVHSTGTPNRLNRSCFLKYHNKIGERSREELIAEVGSLLLASEAGFRDDSLWAENSDNYVLSWIQWLEDHPTEVVNAMLSAEKAKQFILNGGKLDDLDDDLETLNSATIS